MSSPMAITMPTLAATRTVIPCTSKPVSSTSPTRSAKATAAASSQARTSTPNSSPPSRVSTSSGRTRRENRSAISFSSVSPAVCPSASFTSLKPSRSIMSRANRSRRPQAARSDVHSWRRLPRPVRSSVTASRRANSRPTFSFAVHRSRSIAAATAAVARVRASTGTSPATPATRMPSATVEKATVGACARQPAIVWWGRFVVGIQAATMNVATDTLHSSPISCSSAGLPPLAAMVVSRSAADCTTSPPAITIQAGPGRHENRAKVPMAAAARTTSPTT